MGRVAHGAVPVANDGLSDQSSEVIGILPAHTLDRNGDVRSWDRVVTNANFRPDELGTRSSRRSDCELFLRRLEAGEMLFGQLHKLLVGNTAGANKNHTVGLVVGGNVVLQVALLDGQDVLLRAQDGASEGLTLESGRVKVIEHYLFQLLINLLLFAQDDGTLALNRALFQSGVLQDIGQNLNRLSDVILEGLGVVDGVLALVRISA